MIKTETPWAEAEFVAFDTETSGAYPIGYEIVEFGAVRWKNGKIIDTYQTLLKPREPMSSFIIGIHGITNEMVADAPLMEERISEIRDFFSGAYLMAHHAPFDMGFVAADFEAHNISFPEEPVLCTSLLSRVLIPESPNHKLQTLIGELGLARGTAHRAHDDAKACLEVGLECFRRLGEKATVAQALKSMGKSLNWESYRLRGSGNERLRQIVDAIQRKRPMDIVYEGGSSKGETRRITPIGVVRNPDGDYVMAMCHRDAAQKRFYLSKMKDAIVTEG
jgi:DNA polymerase-3 subunit epsilon